MRLLVFEVGYNLSEAFKGRKGKRREGGGGAESERRWQISRRPRTGSGGSSILMTWYRYRYIVLIEFYAMKLSGVGVVAGWDCNRVMCAGT